MSQKICEPAISDLGLRYASAMSEIAGGDRSSLSTAMTLLPQWMKQVSRCIGGISDHRTSPIGPDVQSVTIHKASTWRLGVLRLGPDASIPLHDHPGAYAVSHVLTGAIMIDAFSLEGGCSGRTAELRHARSAEYISGESAVLDPWDVNVHRLQASRHGAIILTSVFAHKTLPDRRHWFLETTRIQNGAIIAAVVSQAVAHIKMRPLGVDFTMHSRVNWNQ